MEVKIKEGGQFLKKYARLIEKIRETLENEIQDPKIVENKIEHFGLKVQKALKRFKEKAEDKNHPFQIMPLSNQKQCTLMNYIKGKKY